MDRRNLVTFVERALIVKSLPVLSEANPDQIAAIVDRLVDRSFMPGAPVVRQGELARDVHIIFEGRVRHESADRAARLDGRGQVIGLFDALEQQPYTSSRIAETAVHTLVLAIDDLLDLLEDFFDLARALVGYMAERLATRAQSAAAELIGAAGPPLPGGDGELDLFDKIVFMKGVPLLAGASVDELARLGREVRAVQYQPGEPVLTAGERADAFYLVQAGRLGAFGTRGSVAVLDVLAQRNYASTVIAMEPSRALRVPAEPFFDLLEDHFDLTSRIARDLVRATRRALAADAIGEGR